MKKLRVLILVLLLLLPSTVRAKGQDIKIITKAASDELTDDTERDIERMILSYVYYSNILKRDESVRVIVSQPIYLFGDIVQYDFPVIIDNKVVSIFEHRIESDSSSGGFGTTNYAYWLNDIDFPDGSVISLHKRSFGVYVTDGTEIIGLNDINEGKEMLKELRDDILNTHNELIDSNYEGYKLMNISELMSPYVTKIVDRSDMEEYDRSGNPPRHGNTNYDDRDSWITIQETNLKFLNYIIVFDLIVIAIFSVLIFFELRKKREYQDKNSNQID